jgi:hypothetical protein
MAQTSKNLDPQKVLEAAKSYWNACGILKTVAFNGQEELLGPVTVLSAFMLELLLKALVAIVNGGVVPHTHAITNLLKVLPQCEQQAIRKFAEPGLQEEVKRYGLQKDFDCSYDAVLCELDRVFMDWRYPFEKVCHNSIGTLGVIPLCDAISLRISHHRKDIALPRLAPLVR